MSQYKANNVDQALELLIAYFIATKSYKEIEKSLPGLVDSQTKSERLSASVSKLREFIGFCSSVENIAEQTECLQLQLKYDIEGLLTNSIASFQKLTDEQKRDKDFLMVCLRSGVDGRILSHVNPFVLFTSLPEDEDDITNWYETANLDSQFIGDALKLNEHCFLGILNNDDVKIRVGDGYGKFDISEDENIWADALRNPKFLRYHSDFSLGEFVGEAAGTLVEQAFNETIAKVKSDLNDFASSIIRDYFFPFDTLERTEEKYDIKFDDRYFKAVAENKTEEPTLSKHAQYQEIYESTKLLTFEAIIKFIYAH